MEMRRGVIALFGVWELLAGGMLLRGPAVSTNVWNRVVGDDMDLAALGLAFTRNEHKATVEAALGFVASVTLADVLVARGLDRETGRSLPSSQRPPSPNPLSQIRHSRP